jgi:membrane-bound lytic murein transglycosylase D
MSLTLPLSHLGDFIDLSDTIRNYKPELYLSRINLTADPSRSTYLPPDVKGKSKIIYTVRDGDNLGFISEWFKVGLSDLRFWNNIYRNTIRVGQRLAIYVDPSKSDYYSKINTMSFAEKQQLIGKTVTSSPVVLAVLSGSEGDYVTYTVRYGDTIWDIVKMFDNVSTSDVLSLNNISDPSKIKVGQVLKIKKKS